MTQLKTKRIESLDILKGIVILLMALDHTRDYFHADAFLFDPADPEKSNYILFFTRWLTHFCAPAFSFLSGISAYLVGIRKSKAQLSTFLLKRGIWLIFIEFTIVYFGWSFNIYFEAIGLLVIWSLGISMIFLAAIIHFSMRNILILSLVIICGHNLLDDIHFDGSIPWAILHEQNSFVIFNYFKLRITYPIIPWIGVMALGYYFGKFYDKEVLPEYRQKLLSKLGLSITAAFFVVRGINLYGNADPWIGFDSLESTIISFMDPSKYPPSLTYLLMTLGPVLVFLGQFENIKGRVVDFCATFGKVPFFIYILHIYAIHLFAILLAEFTGFGFGAMVLTGFVVTNKQLVGYGIDLIWVYVIWASIMLILYPCCKWFSHYKLNHKENWWLSYL